MTAYTFLIETTGISCATCNTKNVTNFNQTFALSCLLGSEEANRTSILLICMEMIFSKIQLSQDTRNILVLLLSTTNGIRIVAKK